MTPRKSRSKGIEAMDDWGKQFDNWFGQMAVQAEQQLNAWADTIDQQLEPIMTSVETAGDELAKQLEQTITVTLAPLVEEVIQPMLDTPLDIEFDLDQTIDAVIKPWHQTFTPPQNNHHLCTGCQYYHGESYNGQMLVCGMYPYGPQENQTHCPDKVDVDWQEPWKTWLQTTWPSQSSDPD